MNPLDRFAAEPRWVAWRNEFRPNSKPGDNPTKIPYAPHGNGIRKAEADNPATWGTKAQALACPLKRPHGGGIGIELGDLGGDLTLSGIDVDSCRGRDGSFADWAKPILQELDSTYVEISPSLTGVKAFFLVETTDVRWFLDRIGVPATGWGARRGVPGYDAKDHGPAIEPFFGGKYFTVTGKSTSDPPRDLVLFDRDALDRLARLIPPASGPGSSSQKDRSALALGKAGRYCRAHPGCTYADMAAALRADPDPDIAAWIREKGEIANERELKKIWEIAKREKPGAEQKWDDDIARRVTEWNGREFVRQADGRWFDEYRAELVLSDGGDFTVIPSPVPSWKTNSMQRWADREISDRRWFAEDWIPLGQVVGLYGKPGSRKSTLILQLMIAGVLGRGFGNIHRLTQGPAYGLFCEDGEMEIARRARAMLNGYGATFRDLQDCHAESLVTANLTTLVRFNRVGRMLTTPAWDKFLSDIDHIKPIFVALDVIADFFGGDEIRRGQVGDFVRLLDATAFEHNFALLFSAHPSLRGVVDRSLGSGSTGWEGKVRGALTLQDPTDDDDTGDPVPNQSDRRVLRLRKANYSKHGAEMRLVFRDGRFVPEDTDPESQVQKKREAIDETKTEDVFVERLKKRLSEGRYVSPTKGTPSYAPSALAGDGFTVKILETAMNRLFEKKIVAFDPAKRGVSRWRIHGSSKHTPGQQD